jgi:hypothetical protein
MERNGTALPFFKEKPYNDKYKEIANDRNYGARSTLRPLPDSDLQNSKTLIFVSIIPQQRCRAEFKLN